MQSGRSLWKYSVTQQSRGSEVSQNLAATAQILDFAGPTTLSGRLGLVRLQENRSDGV
jgi:hypothetical protein